MTLYPYENWDVISMEYTTNLKWAEMRVEHIWTWVIPPQYMATSIGSLVCQEWSIEGIPFLPTDTGVSWAFMASICGRFYGNIFHTLFEEHSCRVSKKLTMTMSVFHGINRLSGWWFGTFFIFSIYWEESSQLTNIFQRGSNHQLVIMSCQ